MTAKHANGKALASLILGVFAIANVILTVLIFVFWSDQFDGSGLWLLPPFLAFCAGVPAAFLGSLGWIDVRRGVTDQRLREAQFGSILGGIAAGLVVLSFIVAVLAFIALMFSFSVDGGGID
ncbi:MAG: hypothetical protein KDB48_06970 [Solirubrobacterales bacterium]|nr:hypothetical protein [Solirubrobacterales bacterium]HMT04490.1 hypothetical protein [Solirubrobacterales bacterium]